METLPEFLAVVPLHRTASDPKLQHEATLSVHTNASMTHMQMVNMTAPSLNLD
jgi:hypothetical protein